MSEQALARAAFLISYDACMDGYARVLGCINDYDAERWSWGGVESSLSTGRF